MTMTSKINERESLLTAAEAALNKGWYVFATPYKSKVPYAGTKGSRDAVNDDRALARWKNGIPANPCIRLDKSNLVVLDIDYGLTSLEHAEAWALGNNLPETYVVSSGREGGGFHFYFRGRRTLPDCVRNPRAGRVGFELNGVSGDIKHHGHVVAEGGLHKSGLTYRGNGKHVAPLPDWIRDYEDPAATRRRERQETAEKKRAEGCANTADFGGLIETGGRHDFLLREAGKLRWQGLGEQALYAGLKDICLRFCKDGADYCDADLRRLAKDIGAKPCARRIKKSGLVVTAPPQTPRDVIAQLLRREFPIGCLVPIHTITSRITTEYPDARKTTIQRAMRRAGFRKSGKDPADRRKPLWTRRDTQQRPISHRTPIYSITDSGLNRISKEDR